MQSALICPFTKESLELLSDADLSLLNRKIEAEKLFFQPGVPVDFKLDKAYVSANRVYAYPVIDGILLLQPQTAIVDRNQTVNPTRRITEEDVVTFHTSIGLGLNGKFVDRSAVQAPEPAMSADVFERLAGLLSRQGNLLVTQATRNTDNLHKLIFSLDYEQHIHIDYDADRLREVVGKLSPQTLYVLYDPSHFPIRERNVDGAFVFNNKLISGKEEQKAAYIGFVAALNPDKKHVCLVDKLGKNYMQSAYNADLISSKLKVWKKTKMTKIHFEPITSK